MGKVVNFSSVSYFVDTNLFFQCHPLERLDWTPWDRFTEVRLIVSSPILREIDYRKNKGNDRVANRARATSAMFREMLNQGERVVRDKNPQVVLSIEPEHTYTQDLSGRLNYQERDDQLVGTLHKFVALHEGMDVRLLTHDTTPLYTARGLGLSADIIPEDWLLPQELTKSEKELVTLRSEVTRLKKTEPSFAIRCVDRANIELNHYEASFTWFEPLVDEQVNELILRLKDHFPMESDFGSRKPAERTTKGKTVLDILTSNTKEVYIPATDEEIKKYREEAYPKWLDQCEEILRNFHQILQHQASLPEFTFLAENVGTRPATDALVTVEAQGHFQIQPPASGDGDDEQSGEDGKSTYLRISELPRPPVAPRGQWRSKIGGHPEDLLRAINKLTHPFYAFADAGPAAPIFDSSWLNSLNVRPPLHDPNAFYYKPNRPPSPQSSFSLSCDQWRHDDGEEPFDCKIYVPADLDKTEGALSFRIQAGNLSRSASKQIPVRIAITHTSAFEDAQALVEKLIECPRFRFKLSSDRTSTSD